MVNFRKLFFYVFLLFALSASSGVAVLKLSENSKTQSEVAEVQESESVFFKAVVDGAVSDLVDRTNQIIGSGIHVSVKPEADEFVVDVDEPTANIFIDETEENEPEFAFQTLSAVRNANVDDEIVFDDDNLFNQIADELAGDDFDEIVFDSNDEELEIADDEWELVFDENDVELSDNLYEIDDVIDVEDEDDIVFDSNDEDDDEIVDLTEVLEEDEEVVFVPNDEDDEEEIVDLGVLFDEDEIVFDENELVSDEDGDVVDLTDIFDDEDEIVFDPNDEEDDEDEITDLTDVFDEESEVASELEDQTSDEVDDIADDDDAIVAAVGEANASSEIDEISDVAENSNADVSEYDDLLGYGSDYVERPSARITFRQSVAKDELQDISAMETEAGFFEFPQQDVLIEEAGVEEADVEEASVEEVGVEEETNVEEKIFHDVEENDSYRSEVVYDSDETDDDENVALDLTPNETRIDASEEHQVQETETPDATNAENEERDVVDPCMPVVVCMQDAGSDAESESDAVFGFYYRAVVETKVSAEVVPDVVSQKRVDDELWIVAKGAGSESFWQYENGSWNQKESKSFFQQDDPGRVTLFWAHGYQTDMSSATRGGFMLKSVVERSRAATGIDRKYRIVIWKWDSERNNNRLRVDAKEKRDLAYYRGAELGRLIGRLNPKDDVVLVGFSFGAVVTGSALQTLATTPNAYMEGRRAPAYASSGANFEDAAAQTKTGRVSLILLSAACDFGAFNPGGLFSAGAQLPERVINVYNPGDFALKFYPLIASTSQALGVAPLFGNEFVNAIGMTYNLNSNSVLGKEHSFEDAVAIIPSTTFASVVF